MATITKRIRDQHGFNADIVPPDVLAKIDQAELLDRLVHAGDLIRKSSTTGDRTLRRGYADLARAVLAAQPRAAVRQRVSDLVAKAEAMPGGAQADALRRQARDFQEQNPAAPQRDASVAIAKAVVAADAKAKASGLDDDEPLQILYDAAGRPFGVCPVSAIQPVTTDAVAKAGKAPRRPASAPGRR